MSAVRGAPFADRLIVVPKFNAAPSSEAGKYMQRDVPAPDTPIPQHIR